MNVRGLALKAAVVGIVAAAGVGAAAAPASAMTAECARMAYWNVRFADWLNEDGITFSEWNRMYDLWLRTEEYLDNNC